MPEHVHFVELAGASARERLQEQARTWRSQDVDTMILMSDDQEGLWLLIGRSRSEPPPARVDGARCWRFRTPDAVAP